jgi:hypothetical protein
VLAMREGEGGPSPFGVVVLRDGGARLTVVRMLIFLVIRVCGIG